MLSLFFFVIQCRVAVVALDRVRWEEVFNTCPSVFNNRYTRSLGPAKSRLYIDGTINCFYRSRLVARTPPFPLPRFIITLRVKFNPRTPLGHDRFEHIIPPFFLQIMFRDDTYVSVSQPVRHERFAATRNNSNCTGFVTLKWYFQLPQPVTKQMFLNFPEFLFD